MAHSLSPVYDQQLQRDVVEFKKKDETYRCVAQLGNRYKLTGLLSVGGFGVIYEAIDTRLSDKKVLIKANRYERRHLRVPNNMAVVKEVEKQRERLEHERRMLLQAQKRDIAQAPLVLEEIKDLGLDLYGPHQADNGQSHYYDLQDLWRQEPFLVLSYVGGLPLDVIMDNQTENLLKDTFFRNQWHFTKSLIIQIGRLLQRFHQENKNAQGQLLSFIYQDLKPANIIFTWEKNFILIDFASFAVRVNGKTQPEFARTGTLGYQPPEFAPSYPADLIDARADVFALGATVYHIMTQQAPRANAQGQSVFDEQAIKKFPEPWQQWLEKATHNDLSQRYANMESAIKEAYNLPIKAEA